MTQLGWKIDLTRCIGCRACQVACKSENNTGRVSYRNVIFEETGAFPGTKLEFVTMACNHCAAPACRAACPVSAIIKDPATGIVWIDQDLCIGCQRCVWACPYGAPRFNRDTGLVEKCHFCKNRQENGLNPACVNSCVGRALTFGDISILGNSTETPARFADTKYTNPSIRFIR